MVAMVMARTKVVGGDFSCSTSSSSPLCSGSSWIVGISENFPNFFAFFEVSPSEAFCEYTLCLGWCSVTSFLFLDLVAGGDLGASLAGVAIVPLPVSLSSSSSSSPYVKVAPWSLN